MFIVKVYIYILSSLYKKGKIESDRKIMIRIQVMPMSRSMTDEEAEVYILNLLRKKGPLTTKAVEDMTKAEGRQCPDGTMQFLTKLRFSGKIKGEVSLEQRGWIWWTE